MSKTGPPLLTAFKDFGVCRVPEEFWLEASFSSPSFLNPMVD
ncbi:rCG21807 [Rattus norvegicus]|uniref:RCG21807 n=1 Tax=Rattus norvegicus TaxID=10116 RepID=A6J1K8_RAT|nr:rCG21807 [Rattus norvegicus]